MSRQQPINNIVIAGGGTTGWLSAALIAKSMAGRDVTITVIDNDTGSPVRAAGGEPTLPQFAGILQRLNIDEREFMRETDASFRLATRFSDWNKTGHNYIEPCGAHGASIEHVAFHHFALKSRLAGSKTQFNQYSLAATAAAHNRFSHPVRDPGSILSTLVYAWHVDTTLCARFFRTMAENLGVQSIEASIKEVLPDKHNGFIHAIQLNRGETISGELFLDCSGSGSVLNKSLENGYEDWSQHLPANRMLTVAMDADDVLPSSTAVGATDTGWLQHVPLRNQNIYKLIFNDRWLADDEAFRILSHHCGGEFQSEPALSSISPGYRNRFWHKNCVAIGSAAGTIDPLAGSFLQLVYTGVERLLNLFPDTDCDPLLATEYNRQTLLEYQNIRDFTQLHYLNTERSGSAFWKQCRESEVPASLAHKIKLFRSHGQMTCYERETFDINAWAAVLIGQQQWPANYEAMLESYDMSRLRSRFSNMRDLISQAVRVMPGHRTYLDRYCPL